MPSTTTTSNPTLPTSTPSALSATKLFGGSLRTVVRGTVIVTGLLLTLGAAGAVAARATLGEDAPLRIRFVRQSPLPPTAAAAAPAEASSDSAELLHDATLASQTADNADADNSVALGAPLISRSASIRSHGPRVVLMEVTAYCPCVKCCGPKARGLTASGKAVSYNRGKFVAADSMFKFGTKLVIPGYNNGSPVEVVDRGGAIKGNKLDVFFPTHEEAKKWGRKTIAVTILN